MYTKIGIIIAMIFMFISCNNKKKKIVYLSNVLKSEQKFIELPVLVQEGVRVSLSERKNGRFHYSFTNLDSSKTNISLVRSDGFSSFSGSLILELEAVDLWMPHNIPDPLIILDSFLFYQKNYDLFYRNNIDTVIFSLLNLNHLR